MAGRGGADEGNGQIARRWGEGQVKGKGGTNGGQVEVREGQVAVRRWKGQNSVWCILCYILIHKLVYVHSHTNT